VALHLDDGTIQLNDDNTVEVKDVDIVFDTLKVQVCFDLPGFSIPSFCLVPDPWNGCLVVFPGSASGADLRSTGSERLVRRSPTSKRILRPSIMSIRLAIRVGRTWMPSSTAIPTNGAFSLTRFGARGSHRHSGTVGNLLENAVKDAVNNLFPSWLPGWAKDLVWAFLGPILDLIKGLLGIVGEINDFISNLLGNLFDLLGLIETAVADYFANQYPL